MLLANRSTKNEKAQTGFTIVIDLSMWRIVDLQVKAANV